jgi:hypothetical protein
MTAVRRAAPASQMRADACKTQRPTRRRQHQAPVAAALPDSLRERGPVGHPVMPEHHAAQALRQTPDHTQKIGHARGVGEQP